VSWDKSWDAFTGRGLGGTMDYGKVDAMLDEESRREMRRKLTNSVS
jgi:hypothetical protein